MNDETYISTREALHAVAELLLAGPAYATAARHPAARDHRWFRGVGPTRPTGGWDRPGHR